MENTTENTNGQGDSALRLIQLAADALVTYENCAGLSKADACWEGMKLASKELEEMGGKMPDHNTLRLIGRYNGAGAARLGLQALKNS
jgi:hypothetical protein